MKTGETIDIQNLLFDTKFVQKGLLVFNNAQGTADTGDDTVYKDDNNVYIYEVNNQVRLYTGDIAALSAVYTTDENNNPTSIQKTKTITIENSGLALNQINGLAISANGLLTFDSSSHDNNFIINDANDAHNKINHSGGN